MKVIIEGRVPGKRIREIVPSCPSLEAITHDDRETFASQEVRMMRCRLVLLTLFAVSIAFPQSARAWNATGHELVAGIAWDHMTPAARQKAIELLEAAPQNACLLDLFPTDSRPLEVRQREFFMRAATWPDVIPRDNNDHRRCTRFSQREWHFIDHFWQGFSDGTGGRAPRDRIDIEIPDVNAIERLAVFDRTVACSGNAEPSDRRGTE